MYINILLNNILANYVTTLKIGRLKIWQTSTSTSAESSKGLWDALTTNYN